MLILVLDGVSIRKLVLIPRFEVSDDDSISG